MMILDLDGVYLCNPELFENCKKTSCQKECVLTTFKECAMTDEFGNPIPAIINTGKSTEEVNADVS